MAGWHTEKSGFGFWGVSPDYSLSKLENHIKTSNLPKLQGYGIVRIEISSVTPRPCSLHSTLFSGQCITRTLLQTYFTKKRRETSSHVLFGLWVIGPTFRKDDSMSLKAMACLLLNIKDLFSLAVLWFLTQ